MTFKTPNALLEQHFLETDLRTLESNPNSPTHQFWDHENLRKQSHFYHLCNEDNKKSSKASHKGWHQNIMRLISKNKQRHLFKLLFLLKLNRYREFRKFSSLSSITFPLASSTDSKVKVHCVLWLCTHPSLQNLQFPSKSPQTLQSSQRDFECS